VSFGLVAGKRTGIHCAIAIGYFSSWSAMKIQPCSFAKLYAATVHCETVSTRRDVAIVSRARSLLGHRDSFITEATPGAGGDAISQAMNRL
jgi:hypothetical protein